MNLNTTNALPSGDELAAAPTILPPPPPPPGALPPPPPLSFELPPPPPPPAAMPAIVEAASPIDAVLALFDSISSGPQVAAPEFPPDVRHYLMKVQRLSQEAVDSLSQLYRAKQAEIPGMPAISSLADDDGPTVELLPGYSSIEDANWEGLRKRAANCAQHELDAGNPYLPGWISKSEDKESPWLNDMGPVSDTGKNKVSTVCRMSSPLHKGKWANALAIAPCGDPLFMDDLTQAIIRVQSLFVWDMGEGGEANWRWSTSFAFLAGLGSKAVRKIFSSVQNEEDLDHWVTCSDEEYAADALKCRTTSGYPMGLIRCEWPRLQAILGGEVFAVNGAIKPPRVLVALMALHVLKHTRILVSATTVKLIVTHRGVCNIYELPRAGLNQTFMSALNRSLCKDLCYNLGLPSPGGANPTWLNFAAQEVFTKIMPTTLCRARPVADKCVFLPGPSTYVESIKERNSETKWVNPGIAIRNVALCDMETGVVDKDYVVTGHETIMYDWPRFNVTLDKIQNWRSQMPSIVYPERASVVLERMIKNINMLGFPVGYRAILDAIMTADLARSKLAGSPIGVRLTLEFPLFYILPMGHTMETTTNQGKTNLGRIIGGAFVPGLPVINMNMSSSAPAQRVLGVPLETYGTAIFDEFQIPNDPIHFMNSSGLQALATGGSVSPGKAGENAEGLSLQHPLILVSKVAVAPEDIINRTFPTFMDVLTEATRAVGSALTDLMSGTGYMVLRLSHLMWMEQNGIIDQIKAMPTESTPLWRFDGHFSIATMFAPRDEIENYMKAAKEQLKSQYAEAERSGLVDQVGMNLRFDPKWYFTACSDKVMDTLVNESTGLKEGSLSPDTALRELVEDDRIRRLDSVLSQFRIKEYAAVQMLVSNIGDGWTKPGYQITYVSKDESKITKSGELVAYIKVERVKDITPNAQAHT